MPLSLFDLETLEREAKKSTTFRYSKFDEYILIRDLSKSVSYVFELGAISKRKARRSDSESERLASNSPRSPRSNLACATADSKIQLVRITNDSSRPYMKYLFDRHSIISMLVGNITLLGMTAEMVSITQPTTTPASLIIGKFKYEYADTTPLFNMREIKIKFKKANFVSMLINRAGSCEFVTIHMVESTEPFILMIKHRTNTSEDHITYAEVVNVSGLIPANYTNKQWRIYTAAVYNAIVESAFYKYFMY